jgi:hypothetical protein
MASYSTALPASANATASAHERVSLTIPQGLVENGVLSLTTLTQATVDSN